MSRRQSSSSTSNFQNLGLCSRILSSAIKWNVMLIFPVLKVLYFCVRWASGTTFPLCLWLSIPFREMLHGRPPHSIPPQCLSPCEHLTCLPGFHKAAEVLWMMVGPRFGPARYFSFTIFWQIQINCDQIVGWVGYIKVDGKTYSFLGAPNVPEATFEKAIQKSSQVFLHFPRIRYWCWRISFSSPLPKVC